jgi:Electron transfer DM13
MTRSKKTLIATGAVLLAAAWYAFRPELLWVDQIVNERFDTTGTVASGFAGDAVTSSTMPPTVPLTSGDVPAATPMGEPMPQEPSSIARGSFHSNAHETKGHATVFRRSDGRRILRLTEFETSNGPDLRVYLVAAPDVNDDATVKRAGFVELGKLKGNRGDQNYEIPASVDVAKFRSVTIWCKRFSVNFGTAPLAGRA